MVWGKNGTYDWPDGAPPNRRDLKNVETHMLDTGHFALETHGGEMAIRVKNITGEQPQALGG